MRYLKWFYRSVKPYFGSVLVMMMCHVLLVACSIGFVVASKKLVDVAVAVFHGASADGGLVLWGIVMAAIVIARIGLNAARSYLQTRTEIRLKNRMRRKLFDILLHLRNDGNVGYHSGDVLNRMQDQNI